MTNVWFTSDLHIGHKVVALHRGFFQKNPEEFMSDLVPDTEAHDAHLAFVWDDVVRPDDTVWVLGDISINGGQHALDWIAARPGTKRLITGNHDPVGPHDRRAPRLFKHWMQYFDSIQSHHRLKLEGINFLLSHYPYWPGDRGTPRNPQHRVPNLGLPLLHGHTHSNEVLEFENSFHVGWDAHGTLVPQEVVQVWLKTL